MSWLADGHVMAAVALAPVAGGFLLDIVLGDPVWLYHPVRLIGKLIGGLEAALRGALRLSGLGQSRRGQLAAGAVLTLLVPAVSLVVPLALLHMARQLSPWLGLGLETLFCYQILAVRSLRDETMRVHRRLAAGDLPGARSAVGRVVGRDTECLTEEEVSRAAVETVAENTTDGVIAPLCYLVLGGAPLAWCYKAVNTLDSMVGYRNERYRYFGAASARLDDVANYLPARLAAACMLLAARAEPFDEQGAWRVFRRDRRAHASPNSGLTEAACAGALGLTLGGDACYGGVLHRKPTIGDGKSTAEAGHIRLANRLMLLSTALCLGLLLALKWSILLWIFHRGAM